MFTNQKQDNFLSSHVRNGFLLFMDSIRRSFLSTQLFISLTAGTPNVNNKCSSIWEGSLAGLGDQGQKGSGRISVYCLLFGIFSWKK